MKTIRCRHCNQTISVHLLAAHLRDTGDVTDLPPHACPELFVRRSTRTSGEARPDAALSGMELAPL